MADIKILKNEEEALITPIAEHNPSGEFLLYEPIYETIREHARADDSLPKGIWEFNEKSSDWKKVQTLCLHTLTQQSKDIQIACWLTESLLLQHNLQGLYEGIETIKRLCQTFWPSIHPLIEDGDEEFRCSPLIWLNEKVAPHIKRIPVFYSIQTMEYSLPTYYYNLTQMNIQGQEDKAAMVQQWKDGALAAPDDDIASVNDLCLAIEASLKHFSHWLDTKLSHEQVSFQRFYVELDNIKEGLEYMRSIRAESRQNKEQNSSNQAQPDIVKKTPAQPASQSVEEPPQQPTVEQPDAPSEPQQEPTPAAPASTPPALVEAEPIPLTRQEIYVQLRKLINTLKLVDPQSPIADLLNQIVDYERLSFQDILSEYKKSGTLYRIQQILDLAKKPSS